MKPFFNVIIEEIGRKLEKTPGGRGYLAVTSNMDGSFFKSITDRTDGGGGDVPSMKGFCCGKSFMVSFLDKEIFSHVAGAFPNPVKVEVNVKVGVRGGFIAIRVIG